MSGVDPGAQAGEHGGKQRQRGGEDRNDRQHDPQRHAPKRRARYQQHRGEGEQHGDRRERDRLAGGVHGLGHRLARPGPVAGLDLAAFEGRAEPDDQEQGVVDA